MQTSVSKIIRLLLPIVLLTLVLGSCVDEYWPDIDAENEEMIVVNGKITNDAGPYTVKLSKSSPLEQPTDTKLSGATIIISDDVGNSETLTETDPGTYQTSETGIRGVVGRKYKITITANGKTYESAYEELLAPVGIESLHYKEEIHNVSETADVFETGYQFYVTSETASSNKTYYYWELEETYEYHAPYPVQYIYDGSFDEKGNLIEYDAPNENLICWRTDDVVGVFTQSTEYLTEPKIKDLPVNFVQLDDDRMRIQYSIIAKQYTISENAYVYQSNLKKLISQGNGLYSSQPYQVRGNIYNVDNPEELLLGYFITAGVSKSEHLFTPTAVITPEEEDTWIKETCYVTAPDGINFRKRWDWVIRWSEPDDWPFYLSEIWVLVFEQTSSYYKKTIMVIDQSVCIDCRTNGGVTQKPDFWIN